VKSDGGESGEEKDGGWVEISTKRWNWFTSATESLFHRWGETYWKERSVLHI